MCQLVEAIRIENKKLQHIELHNQRLNRSGVALLGWEKEVDLCEIIKIPDTISNERYKCRVVYMSENVEVEITKYEQRKIETLKVVYNEQIEYAHKITNRQNLSDLFQLRNIYDDIIIIKDGFVTDSSSANILFFDGEKWVTPNTPLLKGVQREFLLSKNAISEKTIRATDIKCYKKIKLINAMIDFENADCIEIDSKVFF